MSEELNFDEQREKLVRKLVSEGVLKNDRYIKAMLRVKRHLFVDDRHKKLAYIDNPLPLKNTGQTISAPHMCAYMLEALQPNVGETVLEIGTGSGYQAALLAECVAPEDEPKNRWGHVFTIEIVEELYNFAKDNLKRAGYADRVTCILGDGTLGYPPMEEREIYDRILITAGSPEMPPPLVKQLKAGGVLVAPVGGRYLQQLVRLTKTESGVRRETLTSCLFVPLRGRFGWIS